MLRKARFRPRSPVRRAESGHPCAFDSTRRTFYESIKIKSWIGSQYTVEYSYNLDGSRSQVLLPNGLRCNYIHDDLGQVLDMRYTDSSSNVIAFFTYTYGKTGNRLSMLDTEGLTAYTYDALARLTQANYPDSTFEKLRYDPTGNRTQLETQNGTTDYTYDIANRMLTSGQSNFTWDLNSNMVSKTDQTGITQYTWTGRDRMKEIHLPNGTENTFVHLPENTLLFSSTKGANSEKRFLWDDLNALGEFDQANAVTSWNLDGLLIDEHLGRVANDVLYTSITDYLGSVRLEMSGQTIMNEYTYKAFGGVRTAQEQVNAPYRFAGRRWNEDAELYYVRARFLDSQSGRFIAIDPQRERPLYSYAGNNPVTFVDPLGLYIMTPFRVGQTILFGDCNPARPPLPRWCDRYEELGKYLVDERKYLIHYKRKIPSTERQINRSGKPYKSLSERGKVIYGAYSRISGLIYINNLFSRDPASPRYCAVLWHEYRHYQQHKFIKPYNDNPLIDKYMREINACEVTISRINRVLEKMRSDCPCR